MRSESEDASEMLSDLGGQEAFVPQEFGIEKGLKSSVFQNQIWLTSLNSASNSNALVAVFDSLACKKNATENQDYRFQVFINSVFGQELGEVSFRKKSNEKKIDFAIGDFVYANIVQGQDNKLLDVFDILLEDICRTENSSDAKFSKYSVNQDVVSVLGEILRRVAPDCSFSNPDDSGWFCSMNQSSVAHAAVQLNDLKRHIVLHWQRSSYIFSRRLAVINLLVSSVQANAHQNFKLDDFCKILQRSTSEELPLTFTSKKWQKSVCGPLDLSLRREAAIIGVKSALREINQLKEFFEENAKKGNLQILIAQQELRPAAHPKGNIPHLKLKLRPLELMLTLNNKTYNLSFNDNDSIEDDMSLLEKDASETGCWHPFFSERRHLHELATILKLIGPENSSEESRQTCSKLSRSKPEKELSLEDSIFIPSRYLNKILSSETEFVVPNGSQKYLRLPPGTYAYVIDKIPDDLSQLETKEESSQGKFSWPPKGNSRVTISEWR